MTISLPAVALLGLHGIRLERALLLPVAMPWVVFGLAALFFAGLGRFLKWSRKTQGALILTGGLGNTSFVGFPLLVALYGPESLRIGILTDQPGSFLVLSSLGVFTASLAAARSFSLRKIATTVVRFPPFAAMVIALALTSVPYPAALTEILENLAAPLIPLALVSVGFQMNLDPSHLRRWGRTLSIGLVFKLLFAPALIALCFAGLLGARGEVMQITIVQAATAPMVTGAILADEYDLEPELANLMVAVGIPLSLLTVPAWAWLLRGL